MFKKVDLNIDFAARERELVEHWYKDGIVEKYLTRNKDNEKKFSFLDGPMTANNPMGVHHGWGRTYKDLWQRFYNMRGYAERFQNGFDEQGLWVEVEVEKELGLHSKKDIENLIPGDKYQSLEKFINLCKERVKKYGAVQTDQSKRLGYFMDWDNSYHTSSDQNNYCIWNFLALVNKKGWLYKGRDSVPWCPRCGTAISQHEILTEEYKNITHKSIYFELPIEGRDNEFLLVWTTTPWTIPANVAVAVDKNLDYSLVEGETGLKFWLAKELVEKVFKGEHKVIKTVKGSELSGLKYKAPFDDLPAVVKAAAENPEKFHTVIETDPMILPITTTEGTGLVHTATGAGAEDFKLGKKYGLPVIEVIAENADYIPGFGFLSGENGKKHPELILDYLEQKDKEGEKWVFEIFNYTHRYPTCWRCKTELVWRVVDEWYIGMDKKAEISKGKSQNSKVEEEMKEEKTYREMMQDVTKKINWLPKWGRERELDWLKNMHDWLISKKRYWGLALPIWECKKCNAYEVIGSYEELKEKAVEGWDKFEGHSPHRPWIDEVKIKCSKCNEVISRIQDVGNPWLDAGIVPFSTLPEGFFPADFITESFPGQFKNWFYSMIAMSSAIAYENPFKTILGYASVTDEKGEEMHKSKGNMIEFNEAADKIGVDVMRWMYARQDPEQNLNFGYNIARDVKRSFHMILWNVYNFFITYSNLNNYEPKERFGITNILDKWIVSRLNETMIEVEKNLLKFDAQVATREIESFLNDLSTWYIRRSRERAAVTNENVKDREDFFDTTNYVLVNFSKLLAPFIPFITEEIYTNLTNQDSVHLSDWPLGDEKLIDKKLDEEMRKGILVSSAGNSFRKENNLKVRIPLKKLEYFGVSNLTKEVEEVVKLEVNVYELVYAGKGEAYQVKGDISEKNQDLEAGLARDIIRMIQDERKKLGTGFDEKVNVELTDWPEKFEEEIKRKAMVENLTKSEQFKVTVKA